MAEKSTPFTCRVAKVINEDELVINKGSNANIKEGFRFIIYEVGEEIMDPETKESLGSLEVVKGIGRVTHVQDTMATIESDTFEKNDVITTRRPASPLSGLFAHLRPEEEVIVRDNKKNVVPFDNPQVGDFAKYIP